MRGRREFYYCTECTGAKGLDNEFDYNISCQCQYINLPLSHIQARIVHAMCVIVTQHGPYSK